MYDMWGAGFFQLMCSVAAITIVTSLVLGVDVKESLSNDTDEWLYVIKAALAAIVFYFLVPVLTDAVGLTDRAEKHKIDKRWSTLNKNKMDRLYGKTATSDANWERDKKEDEDKKLPLAHWLIMESYLFVLLTVFAYYFSYIFFNNRASRTRETKE